MADGQRDLSPTIYTIRIKGHLDPKWAEWFYDLALVHESDGTTTLSGPLPDQTALHSVLDRIRDMNLSLISVCSSDEGTAAETVVEARSANRVDTEAPTVARIVIAGGASATNDDYPPITVSAEDATEYRERLSDITEAKNAHPNTAERVREDAFR